MTSDRHFWYLVIFGVCYRWNCCTKLNNFFAFQLLETKSTDRSQTLLQFITSIIQEKYPDLVNFHTDLHFVDKAALGMFAHTHTSHACDLNVEWCSSRRLRLSASIPGRHSSGHPLVRTGDGSDQKGVLGAGRQPGAEGVHQSQLWAAGSFDQRQQDSTG